MKSTFETQFQKAMGNSFFRDAESENQLLPLLVFIRIIPKLGYH